MWTDNPGSFLHEILFVFAFETYEEPFCSIYFFELQWLSAEDKVQWLFWSSGEDTKSVRAEPVNNAVNIRGGGRSARPFAGSGVPTVYWLSLTRGSVGGRDWPVHIQWASGRPGLLLIAPPLLPLPRRIRFLYLQFFPKYKGGRFDSPLAGSR